MTASQWLILMLTIVFIAYAVTAVAYWITGRSGMSIVFVGYAAANMGLIWDAWK